MFLVRHATQDKIGDTLCGRMPGISLNAEGRRQVERLGDRLARKSIAAVYSSPLERARETAEPIAARCGVRCQIVDELNEIDFGGWTGRRFGELDADPAWQAWNAARSVNRPPGGESMLEAQSRVCKALDGLRHHHRDEAVAVVSHADVIRAIVAHHLGLSIDLVTRFDIDPASISTLVEGDWGSKIGCLNEVVP